MAKEQKSFVDTSLLEVDISGLPTPLACVAAEVVVVADGRYNKAPPLHSYHSDQPRYDHTRDS
jgi:hypothetical protein